MIVHVKIEQFAGSDAVVTLHGTPIEATGDEVSKLLGEAKWAIKQLLELQ